MMMKLKNICLVLWLAAAAWSCGVDDEGPQVEVIPPKLLSEVSVDNDAEIVAFLKNHFYNYDEFQSPPADFDYRIRFDTIAGENADKISIFDSGQLNAVEFGSETISVTSADVGVVSGGEVINSKFYYLVVRQGVSESVPTIGDNSILRYEGSLLNGQVFDSQISQPVKFNLSQVVRGFGNGMEYFKTGSAVIENGDGTFTYEDYGIGAIFMPSELAYFNTPTSNLIPIYAPLVFKIDAFSFEPNTDTDQDGIPSILEDLNMDGNLNNDNTDSADEVQTTIVNYLDADDDNDGIPTIEEINLNADGTFLSFKFTNGGTIPDHLNIDL
jgi:FKBP-type peptidyl-prolyl cis-trans isomerase FkpA